MLSISSSTGNEKTNVGDDSKYKSLQMCDLFSPEVLMFITSQGPEAGSWVTRSDDASEADLWDRTRLGWRLS